MTQMKTLEIEPEILEKHLTRYPDRILIGRPFPLGRRGECFIIEGHGVWKLDYIGDKKFSNLEYSQSFYDIAGFSNSDELHKYHFQKFGNRKFYPHIFVKVQTEEQAKQKCLDVFFFGGEK